MTSEFGGDALLTLGSIYGSRSFHVKKDGRLSAVTWDYTWTPGENVAECLSEMRNKDLLAGLLSNTLKGYAPPPHDIAQCPSHGFYAYTDGSDNWGGFSTRISGVIEGYGVTHIGTKGFRAEKAKIVGLVIPDEPKGLRDTWNTFRKSAGFKGKAITFLIYMIMMNVGIQLLTGPVVAVVGGACLILASLYILFSVVYSRIDFSRPNFNQFGLSNKEMYAKIRENYPDAKTFNTYGEMLAYFNIEETGDTY